MSFEFDFNHACLFAGLEYGCSSKENNKSLFLSSDSDSLLDSWQTKLKKTSESPRMQIVLPSCVSKEKEKLKIFKGGLMRANHAFNYAIKMEGRLA